MKKIFFAALAVVALTACSDDTDAIRESLNKNLQVSTVIGNESRALVEGTNFGAGQTIGVSLFDQATGQNYEGKTAGYVNVPYRSQANGTGGPIIWAATGKPIVLSATEGKAIACYPYQAGTDINAMPVTTAGQTDYMYSDWVTGVSSVNPQASFLMHHALTAVDVFLIKGNYSGTAQLTSVTVKSAGLATDAVLKVDGGVLSQVTGAGTAVSIQPNKGLTPGGIGNPVMMVPVPQAGPGFHPISIEMMIDNRKYVKVLDMNQAFKQGYIYRYKLTLHDTRLDVTTVEITPWKPVLKDETVLRPDPSRP